ncbi:MAG TPA: energy transducer TonB [Stellaceae bacterium]|nr:energy transducer TonB [Stellaceae bacterium]
MAEARQALRRRRLTRATTMDTTPDRESVSFALRAVAAASDASPEPHLAATPEAAAAVGPARLDPARASFEPQRPVEAVRRSLLPFALLTSVLLHLLPLAALIDWRVAPAETVPPIPVQLVVVQPPPKPLPAPAVEKKRPRGRLASADMGNPAGRPHASGAERELPAAPRQAPPAELVSALPPPQVAAVPLPSPADQMQQAMLPPQPQPKPAAAEMRRPEPRPRAPAHLGALGPAADRDEYLAYCNALIMRHLDMLPPSFIGGRRGTTILSLLVLDDGRIERISVERSSGYHDIDERVERMVAAVRRFPPVPQWFQGDEMSLEFEMPFPSTLARR